MLIHSHAPSFSVSFLLSSDGVPAADVLRKGLKDLMEACAHVKESFQGSMESYRQDSMAA